MKKKNYLLGQLDNIDKNLSQLYRTENNNIAEE